jgi:Rho-binding antiterminator
MTDYTPVDCGLYSEYELAILHHRRLRIYWHEPDGRAHIGVLMPVDLSTRGGEEFLVLERGDGERTELRLDRIARAEPAWNRDPVLR